MSNWLVVCEGGPLDGQTLELDGNVKFITVPAITAAFVREQREWLDHYGVAWAYETMDGIPEHPRTPPPPPWPEVRYRLERRPEGWFAVLD